MYYKDAEIRCGQCCRLLAKGEVVRLAVKCPRCGAITVVQSGKTAPTPRATSPGESND